jgi:hypothetical protein
MGRVYNVVDSDGHILEPLTLWDDYIDPAFRNRAPKRCCLSLPEHGAVRRRGA